MDVDALITAVLPWLVTWLAHSTVLLALVWALVRFGPRLAPRSEVTLWRAALFGALLTASVPFVMGAPAPAAQIEVPVAIAEPVQAPELITPVMRPPPAATTTTTESEAPVAVGPSLPVVAPAAVAPASPPQPFPWALVLTGVWAAGALLLLMQRALASRRFRRRVADRQPVDRTDLLDALNRLSGRAGLTRAPRLSASARLQSPVAMGCARPEICLPTRAMSELSASQQSALLAHELGHIVRRDAWWLWLERVVTGVLFMQPLHVLARRRIRDATELACDAFAVEATAEPFALAECLAEVAGWVGVRRTTRVVPAMAQSPSLLARRVERLLDDGPSPRTRRPIGIAALAILISVAIFAPGFYAAEAVADEEDAEPREPAVRMVPGKYEVSIRTSTAKDLQDAVLAEIDAELRLLDAALDELNGMVPSLDKYPQVQQAAKRLLERRTQLNERRDALRRALEGED